MEYIVEVVGAKGFLLGPGRIGYNSGDSDDELASLEKLATSQYLVNHESFTVLRKPPFLAYSQQKKLLKLSF